MTEEQIEALRYLRVMLNSLDQVIEANTTGLVRFADDASEVRRRARTLAAVAGSNSYISRAHDCLDVALAEEMPQAVGT